MTADSGDPGSGLEDLDVPDEPDEAELPDIGEGRYLYCVVRVGDDPDFETSGVDDDVRERLREESPTLGRALTELTGHWEYRVEVVETEPIDEEALLERDDRLRELDEKIADAGEGQKFVLEKQYEQHATELRRARRESLADDLHERLADVVREVHALERSPTAAVGGVASEVADDGETLCRLTLLAHEDDETAVGSVLDDVATAPGLEVRFSGPWPPYTFTPELENEDT